MVWELADGTIDLEDAGSERRVDAVFLMRGLADRLAGHPGGFGKGISLVVVSSLKGNET